MTELYSEKFSISYDDKDGDYSRHVIDAALLGQAITGISNTVLSANKELTDEHLELKVTTSNREGSVIVDFLALATSPAALDALKLVGISATGAFAGGSVLELVQNLKGKRVTHITINEDTDEATIEAEGEPPIKTSAKAAKLAIDKRVRESIHDFIQAPIERNPNGVVKVLDEHDLPFIELEAVEAKPFNPLPEGSLESEEIEQKETTCHFTQVNFESSKGWKAKLSGGEEYSVELIDEAFMEQVKQSEKSFTKDDLFGITLEIRTIKRHTRSTILYTVIAVNKHFAHKDRRLI